MIQAIQLESKVASPPVAADKVATLVLGIPLGKRLRNMLQERRRDQAIHRELLASLRSALIHQRFFTQGTTPVLQIGCRPAAHPGLRQSC